LTIGIQVLKSYPDPKMAAELEIYLAHSYLDAGKPDLAEPILDRVDEKLAQLGAEELLSSTALTRGNIYLDRGERDLARSSYEKSLELSAITGNASGQAAANGQLAAVARDSGDFDLAASLYERALALYDEADFAAGKAACQSNLGHIESRRGENTKARDLFRESLRLEQSIGSRRGMLQSLRDLAGLASSEEEIEELWENFQILLDLCRRSGNIEAEGSTLQGMGDLAFRIGDLDAAEHYYDSRKSISQTIGYELGLAVSNGQLANIAIRRGDWVAARSFVEASLNHYDKTSDLHGQAACWAQLGYIAKREANPYLAIDCYFKAIELCARAKDQQKFLLVLNEFMPLLLQQPSDDEPSSAPTRFAESRLDSD
jgi:tetratricopeptide (TPR) repeat protein